MGEDQRPGEGPGVVHAPEQDREVPVPVGPGGLVRGLLVELGLHELPDAPGAEPGLGLGGLHVLPVVRVLPGPLLDEVQLYPALRLVHAGAQGGVLVVFDGALARDHELFKDPVYRVQDLGAASKVVVEVDPFPHVAGEGFELL